MSFTQTNILRKRANDFLEEGRYLIDIKKYDLAIFNLDQYCELILKYKILIKLGFYLDTHSLKELINKLSELDDNIKDLVNKEPRIGRQCSSGAPVSCRWRDQGIYCYVD